MGHPTKYQILEISTQHNIKILRTHLIPMVQNLMMNFGSIGSVGCFSLQGSKPIAAGKEAFV